MIVHVLVANFTHICLSLVESFIKDLGIKNKQYFLLCGECSSAQKESYLRLFDGESICAFLPNIRSLYQYVKAHKEASYLIHGGTYEMMYCLTLMNARINWICWGAGSSINWGNWKSILFTPVKKYMYRRFESIVTLMENDSFTLKRHFNVNSSTIPYYASKMLKYRDLYVRLLEEFSAKIVVGRTKVLLGNNTHNMQCYLETLQMLKKFRDHIEVHCMMQYPALSYSKLQSFREQCEEVFGAEVLMDTKMLNELDYIEYMNNFDVYVCGAESQTGLGAIGTCLLLGKKVYLNGKNYEWIKSQRNIIFHLEDLDNKTVGSFYSRLSVADMKFNASNQYSELENIKRLWGEYIERIDNKNGI